MTGRTCSVSWCDRKHHANGLCRSHNERRRKGLDLETPFRQYERNGVCKVESCSEPRSMSADYCGMHRMRSARTGSVGDAAPSKSPQARTAGLPRLRRAPNGSPQWNQREYKREYRLQLDYGLSHDDLLAMLEAQEYLCAICGTRLANEEDYRDKRGFVVDHVHGTRAVRGLLCQRCNKAIGFFRDDPCLLRAAIAYLEARSGDPCLHPPG